MKEVKFSYLLIIVLALIILIPFLSKTGFQIRDSGFSEVGGTEVKRIFEDNGDGTMEVSLLIIQTGSNIKSIYVVENSPAPIGLAPLFENVNSYFGYVNYEEGTNGIKFVVLSPESQNAKLTYITNANAERNLFSGEWILSSGERGAIING